MTLRLVGNESPKPPPRRKRERTPLLTEDEERRFRAATRGLRDAFGGTWGVLADVMRTKVDTLEAMMFGRSAVSGDLIVRAMQASGLSLKDLLGEPKLVGTCRACGAVRRAS